MRKTGDDPADTLDKVYQDVLTALHAQLKAQLDDLADLALNGPKSQDPPRPPTICGTTSTSAVAHYLFNMVEALDPEARTRAWSPRRPTAASSAWWG